MNSHVAIIKQEGAQYPATPPFHPAEAYPEYVWGNETVAAEGSNDAYAMVRNTLRELGLDAEHFGQPDWNPLGDFISPGQTVVIKPNLVQDRHYKGGDVTCLVTHGSVVRAVMDYIYKALKGKGRIVLGDAPVLSTRFDGAVKAARLGEVLDFFKEKAEPELEVFDFRTVAGELDARYHVTRWLDTPGDPTGNVEFDLADRSMLAPIGEYAHLIRLPHYRVGDTDPYHGKTVNRFVVPRSIMEADVVINLPKLKTHCKAGLTAALKNFVGIVAVRHCYANYRYGDPAHNGDEYPEEKYIKRVSEKLERLIDGNQTPGVRQLLSLAYRISERSRKLMGVDGIYEGRWYGNDTAWRAILDLVRIARYGTVEGQMADKPQRVLFTLTEGIIAGEDEGPLEAKSRKADCMLASLNPVAADMAAAALMQYDWQAIPSIARAWELPDWPLCDQPEPEMRYAFEGESLTWQELIDKNLCGLFVPAWGWRGHVEYKRDD
jgi:uncharacterized protein (DUF362 family)